MTSLEAVKHLYNWIEFANDNSKSIDEQPCSDEEILEAMKICADFVSTFYKLYIQ